MSLTVEPCDDELIHDAHEWSSHEPVPDEPDAWRPVDYWCDGKDDQDDPLFRYECCIHCASAACPRRDGHPDACRNCEPGGVRLGEPAPQ